MAIVAKQGRERKARASLTRAFVRLGRHPKGLPAQRLRAGLSGHQKTLEYEAHPRRNLVFR
jgi:hypothetical protein